MHKVSVGMEADCSTSSTSSADGLFVMTGTLRCALAGCVPCGAKVLVSTAGAASLPNARPETCLRLAAAKPNAARAASIGLYSRGQRILTVGDGDFSFSLALARALGGARLVATSYESLDTLTRVYGTSCTDTLRELCKLGVRVIHGVDAGDLGATLPSDALPAAGFDRIVWNFPCVARGSDGEVLAGAGAGADARGSAELEQNRQLVARFCAGAAARLGKRGEVHLTHKVGLQQWNIPQQGDSGHSAASALEFAGAVVFDRAAYPPYRPRKAFAAKGFPTTDAQTFVFGSAVGGATAAAAATLHVDSGLVTRLRPELLKSVATRHDITPEAVGAAPAVSERKRKTDAMASAPAPPVGAIAPEMTASASGTKKTRRAGKKKKKKKKPAAIVQ